MAQCGRGTMITHPGSHSFCSPRVNLTMPFNTVRKLPGIEKYPHLMLKRGLTGTLLLWQWRQEVRDGGTAFPPVKNVVIQLEDEQHKHVYKWTLTNAWCTKLSSPSLKGQGNEIAI